HPAEINTVKMRMLLGEQRHPLVVQSGQDGESPVGHFRRQHPHIRQLPLESGPVQTFDELLAF
ncbi:MAG: hypothetical protein WAU59_12935, partial [Rhodoplanes sp.]